VKQILKWMLAPGLNNTVFMPAGEILAVQVQQDILTMWSIGELSEGVDARQFAVYGTGHALPADPGKYIGTAQMMDGALVWHVFELNPLGESK